MGRGPSGAVLIVAFCLLLSQGGKVPRPFLGALVASPAEKAANRDKVSAEWISFGATTAKSIGKTSRPSGDKRLPWQNWRCTQSPRRRLSQRRQQQEPVMGFFGEIRDRPREGRVERAGRPMAKVLT